MIIIDATNLLIGRLATYAAKQALLGQEIRIINSEKAVISGKKQNIFDLYLNRLHRGTPRKGPFYSRLPEMLLRRTIRGMLPWKKPKGKIAYKKVFCYRGVPEEFKDKKAITIPEANVSKLPNLKFVDLNTISKRIGAKLE
jgi:large subunit ribosomal protein L13